jgi:hypothetical protein
MDKNSKVEWLTHHKSGARGFRQGVIIATRKR